jgi:signal transduction histidine kinase
MALQQSQLSVLLVEDNPGDAKLVEHHLDAAVTDQYVDDLTLTHTERLSEGLSVVEEDPVDLLLLDLGLPESTGLDTVDRVLDADPGVPIIVLTGLADRDTSVEAIARGVQDYLPKDDLDSDRLIRSLRYALERHEQEQRLQRQTEQMEFFNRILRHDMLNGMNVIQARGELLAADLEGEQAAFAETICEWSDDIIDLTEKIRAILETLTAESDPELHAVDLAPMAESAATRARSLGASVDVSVPEGLSVRAGPLLEDVLSNLTTNAAEHGGEDVSVTLTAEAVGNRVDVTVADDGTGLSATDAEWIFDRGEKGSASGGSGFGLYFVASMVEAYGGSVEADTSDAGGAEFVLDLPSARTFG